jgi:hypothetical protein
MEREACCLFVFISSWWRARGFPIAVRSTCANSVNAGLFLYHQIQLESFVVFLRNAGNGHKSVKRCLFVFILAVARAPPGHS